MSKVIYIPEGYAGQYFKTTKKFGLDGLYTDNFSGNNIIVYVGTHHLLLAHIDFQALSYLDKLTHVLTLLPNDTGRLFILFREKKGEVLKKRILDFFQREMPNQSISSYELLEGAVTQDEGIFVSFAEQSYSPIHPYIHRMTRGKILPRMLIHHPKERELMTVRKIEQVMGLKARLAAPQPLNKKFFIFDGVVWQTLGSAELELDVSHPDTQNELSRFNCEDTYITIGAKLGHLIQEIIHNHQDEYLHLSELRHNALHLTPYLEDYLRKYDHELSFRGKLKYVLESQANQLKGSPADQIFQKTIRQLLNTSKRLFLDTQAVVKGYTQTAGQSLFKIRFLNHYHFLARAYESGKYYEDLKVYYSNLQDNALSHYRLGIEAYKEEDYEYAAQLFLEIITNLTCFSGSEEPNLAGAYYNYGRSLFFLKQYEDAVYALNVCLALRRAYCLPDSDAILNVQKALEECSGELLKILAVQNSGTEQLRIEEEMVQTERSSRARFY